MSIYFKMPLWRTAARKWKWISNGLCNRKSIPDIYTVEDRCFSPPPGLSLCPPRLPSKANADVLSSHHGAIWAKLSLNIKDPSACAQIFNPMFVGLTFNICGDRNKSQSIFHHILEERRKGRGILCQLRFQYNRRACSHLQVRYLIQTNIRMLLQFFSWSGLHTQRPKSDGTIL